MPKNRMVYLMGRVLEKRVPIYWNRQHFLCNEKWVTQMLECKVLSFLFFH